MRSCKLQTPGTPLLDEKMDEHLYTDPPPVQRQDWMTVPEYERPTPTNGFRLLRLSQNDLDDQELLSSETDMVYDPAQAVSTEYDIEGTRGQDFYEETHEPVPAAPSPPRLFEVYLSKPLVAKKRRLNPAWFLNIGQACVPCNRFLPNAIAVKEHQKHVSGSTIFTDAPLLRQGHFDLWARWFNVVCRFVMEVLQVKHPREIVHLVNQRQFNRELPLSPTWSRHVKTALRAHFGLGYGLVHPDMITINPANCICVLAEPVIFIRLSTLYKDLRKASIYKLSM
jgi:hypothetical protein